MPNVLVNDDSLKAIGNAIRGKNGETTTYKPAEMATAITNLPSGSGGNGIKYYEHQPTNTFITLTYKLTGFDATQPIYCLYTVVKGSYSNTTRLLKIDQTATTDTVTEIRKQGYNYTVSYGWDNDAKKLKIIFQTAEYKAQSNGNDITTQVPVVFIGGNA